MPRNLSCILHGAEQVLPVLESAKKTGQAVPGVTTFVADSLVAPLIGIAGFGSAIKGTVRALFGRNQFCLVEISKEE